MSAADTIERAPAVMKAGTSLRTRAWWVMRAMPVFSADDLLMTVATADDLAARNNLVRYIASLVAGGVLAKLPPRRHQPALFRIERDLGPLAPVISRVGGKPALVNPNAIRSTQ